MISDAVGTLSLTLTLFAFTAASMWLKANRAAPQCDSNMRTCAGVGSSANRPTRTPSAVARVQSPPGRELLYTPGLGRGRNVAFGSGGAGKRDTAPW